MLYNGRVKEEGGHAPLVQNDMPEVIATRGHVALYVIICILTLGFFAITFITVKNKLNKLEMKINQAASNIEVQLEKRFDTLNKLVDTAKSHCKFNKETYENIAALRSRMNTKDHSYQAITDTSRYIDNLSRNVNIAFENYPTLGADESIRTLRNEITMIERELAASRRLYNSAATIYNQDIYNFYYDVILSKKGYKSIPLFKVEEYKKADVDVSFFN